MSTGRIDMKVSEEGKWPDENHWKRYTSDKRDRLMNPLPGVDDIKTNWSQTMQDMFVLTMLDGKRNGIYLEIGADQPRIVNNTYLLETEFDWEGVSFEFDSDKVEFFNSMRKNKCICHDATAYDYVNLFKERNYPKQIDYLSLDIDPPGQTLKALTRLPIDHRYSVITFETDLYEHLKAYAGTSDVQHQSQQILRSMGYEMVVENVSNEGSPYEDWWVDPLVVDRDIIDKFKSNLTAWKVAFNANNLKIDGEFCILK